MKLTIPEILQIISDARTHQEKVSLMREYQSLTLEQILQYNFHPDIKFNLPEGVPPYKKETDIPVGRSHTNMYTESRRWYIFLEGQAPNLKPYRREQLYIEMLEGLHYTEAEVFIAVKDKRLEDLYPGVTYEAAFEAFDRLLPHPSTRPTPVAVSKKEEVKEIEVPLVQKAEVKRTPPSQKGVKRGPMSEESKQKLRDAYQRRMAEKAKQAE